MNTTLTIKNFRVFDENGVDVQISPVTILTGCNSSGKSSIVKSILLLDSFLKQIKHAYNIGDPIMLESYKLDFNTYPNNQLGRYDKIVNNKSESKRITFAYTIYSLLLSKDVNVEFTFNTDTNDELNNGFLENFSLSTDEGIIYASGKQIKRICNLNLIKEDAIKFMMMEFLIQNHSNAKAGAILDEVSDEELLNSKKHLEQFIDIIGQNRYRDILKFMSRNNKNKTILAESGCKPEVLEWTYNNSSYFHIPLVEMLKDCSKENIESKIKAEILTQKKAGEQEKEAFGKVIKDFFASECHTFGEYFHMKETEFMDNIAGVPPVIDLRGHNTTPSASIMKFFEIPQGYLLDDPRNVICTWGENGFEYKSTEEDAIKIWLDTPVDFPILYEILMRINEIYTNDSQSPYYKHHNIEYVPEDSFEHYTFKALGIFANNLVLECILPAWSGKISYVSSSRIEVKRLYPLDDSTDFTQLLHKYFEESRLNKIDISGKDGKNYRTNSFTETSLKAFGIGESLSFDVDKDGLGVKIYLHRSKDSEGRLLAYEGYGITQLVSIILQIETAILTANGERRRDDLLGFDNPNKDDLQFHYEQQTIAIEEPEIHLHPKFQSLLADMFAFAYKKYNINFIIETHSEYLIRKMQLLVAQEKMNSEDISLLYVYDSDESKRPTGEAQIKEIGICADGYLNESFGPGFFDEASSLSRQLLK